MAENLGGAGDGQRYLDAGDTARRQRIHHAERLARRVGAHLGHQPLARHLCDHFGWDHPSALILPAWAIGRLGDWAPRALFSEYSRNARAGQLSATYLFGLNAKRLRVERAIRQ